MSMLKALHGKKRQPEIHRVQNLSRKNFSLHVLPMLNCELSKATSSRQWVNCCRHICQLWPCQNVDYTKNAHSYYQVQKLLLAIATWGMLLVRIKGYNNDRNKQTRHFLMKNWPQLRRSTERDTSWKIGLTNTLQIYTDHWHGGDCRRKIKTVYQHNSERKCWQSFSETIVTLQNDLVISAEIQMICRQAK